MSERPLVIAANRLPVQTTDTGWTTSPGGLVRALAPMLRRRGGIWVGWAGQADAPADTFTVEGITLEPVPISAEEVSLYYEGFSNDTLWPLYHDAIRESGYWIREWEAYVAVNQRFADRIAEVAPPDSLVWIHDYHLQLVPRMLREQRGDVRIGWFNHIPFPPLELFQRLPWREELVKGLLGNDLLGFQRTRDAFNFRVAATEIAGARRLESNDLVCNGHRVRAEAFPISIDVAELEHLASGRETRRLTAGIRNRLGDPEVILLGVDRLDYTKGIGPRLRAFGQLLDEGRLDPERHVMVQVATPTREGVEMYQEERREIEQLVGEINGRHARIGIPVIHYLYQTLPLDVLVPLYRAGDVMLVTPFRDGMNLVAKEYVAAHVDGDGVLVLSEFTGAADELSDALLVNPHDDESLKDTIVKAVEMHRHERRPRMEAMRRTIEHADVAHWADSFLRALDQ